MSEEKEEEKKGSEEKEETEEEKALDETVEGKEETKPEVTEEAKPEVTEEAKPIDDKEPEKKEEIQETKPEEIESKEKLEEKEPEEIKEKEEPKPEEAKPVDDKKPEKKKEIQETKPEEIESKPVPEEEKAPDEVTPTEVTEAKPIDEKKKEIKETKPKVTEEVPTEVTKKAKEKVGKKEKDAFDEFVEGPAEGTEKKVPHIVLGKEVEKEKVIKKTPTVKSIIYTLRTTANREGQVMDFVTSNAVKRGLDVFSVVHPHGMRGYIFLEAATRRDAEEAAFRVPYARGILPHAIQYKDIEHMLEKSKRIEMDIRKNDIAEIISGPFKREKCKISRVDKGKEEVVVELLEAAVPIPITIKIDAIKVIRRDTDEEAKT